MKILLPITLSPTGGTSSFAKKFQKGMRAKGHEVIFKFTPDYDVLLASPRAPWSILRHAKRNNKPIIHRLDGVYYPSTVAGHKYWLYNLPLRIIRNHYATSIIYQSKFSKETCNTFLGRTSTPSQIIYNGVDTNHFTPNGAKAPIRKNADQHIFITASRFRREDQIIPLLKSYQYYRNNIQENSKLVIIGNFSKKLKDIPNQKHPGVDFLGIIPNEDLPSYLRGADVFVFTHQNPPCPNNVIEAMACGLPICGVADGAMPELIQTDQNGIMLPVATTGFKKTRQLNTQNLGKMMDKSIKNKYAFSQQGIQIAKKNYQLTNMIDSYETILKKLHNQ